MEHTTFVHRSSNAMATPLDSNGVRACGLVVSPRIDRGGKRCLLLHQSSHVTISFNDWVSLMWAEKSVKLERRDSFAIGHEQEKSSLVTQKVKNLFAMQDSWIHPWVGMVPWRREWQSTLFLPWTEESHRLESTVLQRFRHDWVTTFFSFYEQESSSFWTMSFTLDMIIAITISILVDGEISPYVDRN